MTTYTYNSYNGKLASMTYGNNTTVSYTYDSLDRISQICYNGTVRYEYQYTSDGKLHSVTDTVSNVGYLYDYDSEDRISGYTEYKLDTKTNTLSINYSYNQKNQLVQTATTIDYVLGSNKQTVCAGKQLFKRGFFNQQARDYYFKNAHKAGGKYVFKALLESFEAIGAGAFIITVKNVVMGGVS